ncbi:hypothetical protein NHQ30_005461 [Ciborinia camelliae]|nr:hypothetical protein NHQ30_005461 [Ciborinia camelliae]
MSGNYSKHIITNGFLSPPAETKTTNSKRGRSASVPGSEQSARSSRSRITIVEEDAQIAILPGLEDSDSTIPPNYSCLDHLMAIIRIIFCIPLPKRMKTRSSGPVKGVSSDMESSPWVLPVLVLSTRRDTDKQPIPKRAKCTIDTGNMQGNIVSREFVEKVLEYSESNFVPLTAAEKEGGFGVTGHKLVPEGAIYLTWYHSKSTRVFHNMRSAKWASDPKFQANHDTKSTNAIAEKQEEDLECIALEKRKDFWEKDAELLRAGKDSKDIENDEDWKSLKYESEVAETRYQICKAELAKNEPLVAQLKQDLEKLLGDETSIIPSTSETTSTGIAQQEGSVPTQRTVTSSPKK